MRKNVNVTQNAARQCVHKTDEKVSRGKQAEMEEDVPTPLTHECCMQSLSVLQVSPANEAWTYAIQLVYMSEKLYFFFFK